MTCVCGLQNLGANPSRFLQAVDGGAAYAIYLFGGVVEVFACRGLAGVESPGRVLLLALLVFVYINILPEGIVGALLQPISHYSR